MHIYIRILLGIIAISSIRCHSGDSGVPEPEVASVDTPALAKAPERDTDALKGSEFIARTTGISYAARQRKAVDELLNGNLPHALRTLAPVSFVNDKGDSLTVWVTKDYLSIGSDDDFVRMPLTLPSAQAIAGAFGMYLPTARLVDAIYAQADVQLTPQPMTPGPDMRSNDYYMRHQQLIEEQMENKARRGLIAGHKKDVVVTTRMLTNSGSVPIYGWHRGEGDPIQPLSLVHHAHYADYSHGLRLLHPVAHLNRDSVPMKDLFADPEWKSFITRESGLEIDELSWNQ